MGTKLTWGIHKLLKHEYHEDFWRVIIPTWNPLLAVFVQSTKHLLEIMELEGKN